MKCKALILGLSIVLLTLLIGCRQEPTATPIVSTPLESPLDTGPIAVESPLGVSPLATPTGEVQPIQLNKPIEAGATKVTGHGPAGVPILLQDVTFGGTLLASGVIDQDGRIELDVSPLESRHRVGITLGDLTGTEWALMSLGKAFYGDEARSIPQIGFFYDTCMIRE